MIFTCCLKGIVVKTIVKGVGLAFSGTILLTNIDKIIYGSNHWTTLCIAVVFPKL